MPAPVLPRLTRRETEVLAELCRPIVDADDVFTEPASTGEIAERLVVSQAAIKQHLVRLYDKFGIRDGDRRRLRLANAALRSGSIRLRSAEEEPAEDDALVAGRAAFEQRRWFAAFTLLRDADTGQGGPLKPADLELLAEAAWFSDHHDASDAAGRRAHGAYIEAGDIDAAGRVAVMLAYHSICRLNLAIADGWVRRGSRLIGSRPTCKAAGDLAAQLALIQLAMGELDPALQSARRAVQIGERVDHPDAIALGLTLQGYALIRLGHVTDGLALLDEGMANAAAGLLSAVPLGLVYCRTLGACLDLFDYRRALEWADEVDRRSEDPLKAAFPGDCDTHRVAVRIVRGEWSEGEREAATAATRAFRFDLNHAAEASNALGEIRLRRGDLNGAEEALVHARELGSQAQPGAAVLLLRRGDVEAAAASISGALAAVPRDPLVRARLLPAQVEIALAAGDTNTAAIAATELDGIAERYRTTALRAAAGHARGMVALVQEDAPAAITFLQDASRLWTEMGVPYEAARARVGLAHALATIGDRDGAAVQLRSARATFAALGATLDVEQATLAAEPA